MQDKQQEIHKLIVGTFGTQSGQRLLDYLIETIVDRPSFKLGMSLEEVAFREGQKDVIQQLKSEFKETPEDN